MTKGKMYLAPPYNIDYYSAGFYGQHSLLVDLVGLFHKGFEVQIHYYWLTGVSGLADESALLFFPLDLKSVNSNFTLTVRSRKFGQAKTHLLFHVGEKKRKKWLGRNLNPGSVYQC